MADKKKDEAVYTRPTSQVDLEERLKADNRLGAPVENAKPKPVSDDGYVGVDPIYQNHANDTDAPHQADDGADKLAEKSFEEQATRTKGAEPSEELKENYRAVSRQGESEKVTGGEPVGASVTPPVETEGDTSDKTEEGEKDNPPSNTATASARKSGSTK